MARGKKPLREATRKAVEVDDVGELEAPAADGPGDEDIAQIVAVDGEDAVGGVGVRRTLVCKLGRHCCHLWYSPEVIASVWTA